MMNDLETSSAGAKKILVNPLVAGSNFHYNKGKYTLASSTSVVKESASSSWSDTVHYNPRFLSQNYGPKKDNVHVNPKYIASNCGYVSSSVGIHVNPNFLSAASSSSSLNSYGMPPYSTIKENTSKYKYVRKEPACSVVPEPVEYVPKIEPKTASKYKLVYSTAPAVKPADKFPVKSAAIVMKFKYSLRTCQLNDCASAGAPAPSKQIWNKPRVSREFKRISRTKLVRKSTLRSKLQTSFKPKRRPGLFKKSRYRLNNKLMPRSHTSSECSVFKRYSRTKIVRKSILRAQIDARKIIRKSLNSSVTNVFKFQPLVNSKYKLIRKGSIAKKPANTTLRGSHAGKSKQRKSLITRMTTKLRKNNQRCLFYNRFGRCKGKDKGTCNKIHDPLYVSVCKKLPFGECTDKTCLLSHDVRPGKMPTCYHYLAGICKRDNCPYLHIKVNPKAPICHSFLQGYCPDVFNCLKRHEYVCPIFAEKGSCPKGKSCAHPHKIPQVHSKLLADDQTPLISKESQQPPKPRPLFVVSGSPIRPFPHPSKPVSQDPSESKPKETVEPKPFTRYYAVSLPSTSHQDEDLDRDSPTPLV